MVRYITCSSTPLGSKFKNNKPKREERDGEKIVCERDRENERDIYIEIEKKKEEREREKLKAKK